MDGKTYEHDVIVRLSSEVVKRKKKLRRSTTSPRISFQKTERSLSSKRGASCHFSPTATELLGEAGHQWRSAGVRRLTVSVFEQAVERAIGRRLLDRWNRAESWTVVGALFASMFDDHTIEMAQQARISEVGPARPRRGNHRFPCPSDCFQESSGCDGATPLGDESVSRFNILAA